MSLINETQNTYYSGSGADFGSYQFVSLTDIINAFIFTYTGENKIFPKVQRTEVAFHAQRALQELSFDTLKSFKSQEIEVPPSLQMILPQDYVSYIKFSYIDGSGVKNVIYPTRDTQNFTAISQDADGTYQDDGTNLTLQSESDAWTNYKSATNVDTADDYDDDTYTDLLGGRYGIDPERAHSNGSFYIDEIAGKVHFSSHFAGKTIAIEYVSDGLGTEDEMKVHKFAEEAMYKHIAYAVACTHKNIPEFVVGRFKKEKRAMTRQAKLRLSKFNMEELTQVLRGKSKIIKH